MNGKQKKSPVQGVGKVLNGIFCSSKGWEMQPLRFFILPKFGKAFFRRFSVFPMLGQPFSSVFCSSQVWEIRFSTFSRLPNFGKVSSADFWFSLAGEIRFSLFPSFPSWGKAVFCCFPVHRTLTKRDFPCLSLIVGVRSLVFCVFHQSYPYESFFFCFSFIVPLRSVIFRVFRSS